MKPPAQDLALFDAVPRAHDLLPPRWDGYRVVWDPWHTPILSHSMPAKRCPRCHARTADTPMCVGTVHPPERAVWRTEPGRAYPVRCLTALRCPNCSLDIVLIYQEHSMWTEVILDDSDYGDEGSYPPPGEEPTDFGWFVPAFSRAN